MFHRWKLAAWYVLGFSSLWYRANLEDRLPGGRLTNNQDVVNAGLELNDACWNTYASTEYVYQFAVTACLSY